MSESNQDDKMRQEIERLRGEVARLRNILQEFYNSFVDCVEGGSDDEFMKSAIEALNATSETAEHYRNSIKAEALREAAEWFDNESYTERDGYGCVIGFAEDVLRRMASSLENNHGRN